MKNIIAFEGMDGVGKTTAFTKFIDEHRGYQNIMYVHFPTEGSDAYKVLKHEMTATNEELQRMMLANILEVLRAFYRHPDYSVMVCDRFIFSNYLYNLNETMPEFLKRIESMWPHFDDYSKWEVDGLYALHDYFNLTTEMVYCEEEERIERIFSRPSQDSTETHAFQDALKERFEKIISDPECCDFFRIPAKRKFINTSTK